MSRVFGRSVAVHTAPQDLVVMSRSLPWATEIRPQAAIAVALAPLAAVAPRLPAAPTWSLPRHKFTKRDLALAIDCASVFIALLQMGWLPWEAFVVAMAAWAAYVSSLGADSVASAL
jgi:hypothetical protein